MHPRRCHPLTPGILRTPRSSLRYRNTLKGVPGVVRLTDCLQAFLAGRSKPSAPIAVQHACSAIADRDFSLICRYLAKNGPVGRMFRSVSSSRTLCPSHDALPPGLVLSGCGIDDQRAEILAQCLERNSFLQELDISFNCLTNLVRCLDGLPARPPLHRRHFARDPADLL